MRRIAALAFALTCQLMPSAADAAWSMTVDPKGLIFAHARSKDGHTVMDLTCNGPDRKFGFTFEGYRGRALKKGTDEVDQSLLLKISGKGPDKVFSVTVYFYDGDVTWVEKGNLPGGFLPAFGEGTTLPLKTTTDQTIADFDLAGAGVLKLKMTTVCAIP